MKAKQSSPPLNGAALVSAAKPPTLAASLSSRKPLFNPATSASTRTPIKSRLPTQLTGTYNEKAGQRSTASLGAQGRKSKTSAAVSEVSSREGSVAREGQPISAVPKSHKLQTKQLSSKVRSLPKNKVQLQQNHKLGPKQQQSKYQVRSRSSSSGDNQVHNLEIAST